VHILGVLGLFIAMALELAALVGMRRASTVTQAHEWAGLGSVLGVLFPLAAVLILVSGLYLVHDQWGDGTSWSTLSLIVLIALSADGALLNGRRLEAIRAAVGAAPAGAVPPGLRRQILDPVLWTSVQGSAAVAVGIVYLMTLKPDLTGSLVALVIAAALGVASALPIWRGTGAAQPAGETARE
jgi:hypothetical protein